VGNAETNQLLSLERARAIAAQLTQLDANAFPASRFDVEGLGSTAPVVNTNRQEDLAASRRTEFKLFRCGKAQPPN
jgi:outer membrane protein OmpA-like peptidoglycan-associated protein